MSNKHFTILLSAIFLSFFAWIVYDTKISAKTIQSENVRRDVLSGGAAEDSSALIQYLFNFAAPAYNYDRNAAQIEALSRQGGATEHYHVEGLTQVEFGLQTLYQYNSSKKIFQDVYSMWVENLRVDFSYTTVNVYVTNEYPQDSCEFRATMAHEDRHLEIHHRIYEKYQTILREAVVAAKDIPLVNHPVSAGSVAEGKEKIAAILSGVTDPVFQQFRQELSDEEAALDTPEKYDELKSECQHW